MCAAKQYDLMSRNTGNLIKRQAAARTVRTSYSYREGHQRRDRTLFMVQIYVIKCFSIIEAFDRWIR